LLDSDIIFHAAILTRILSSPHVNTLALREGIPLGEEEIKVQLDGTGRVIRIGKGIPPAEAAGESIGIERFSSETGSRLFAVLARRKERDEFYEESFQELMDTGEDLRTVVCGDLPCMEIDTPEDLRAAELLARRIDG
jgi:choline kinase